MPIVDIEWLKDYVAVPEDLTIDQLSKELVKVGFEEETIHPASVTGPLVVGYVTECIEEVQKKTGRIVHWNQIDVGEYNLPNTDGIKAPRGIVCGAPNIAQGEWVVVALTGAVLPGNFKIVPQPKYGHTSDGMCCSKRELGISNEYDGIILLKDYLSPEQVAQLYPGQDAISLLGLNTPTLEINITPDRGYAFSYRGISNEYALSNGTEWVDPAQRFNQEAPAVSRNEQGDIEVIIDDKAPIHGVPGCDHYYLRTVRNINAAAVTPDLILQRLVRAGSAVSFLTSDIVNYVMLELGEPLTAYDLDKIHAPLVVRRAHAGEKMITLDNVERTLSEEDLVITDSPNGQQGSRVINLAGVMVSKEVAVTSETMNIAFEAAHFDAVTVARTARRHKLPTEASHRYERGTDTQIQAAAVQAAVTYLIQYAGGTVSEHVTNLDTTTQPQTIALRLIDIKRLTDLDLSLEIVETILTHVGCSVAIEKDTLNVCPPTWRPDLLLACDLVEEVARVIGYDQIPERIPAVQQKTSGLTLNQQRQRWVAQTLAESGLVETLTYPYVGDADYAAFQINKDAVTEESVEIVNPLMGDKPWLRTNVLTTLATAVRRNIRRGLANIRLFETGHVYLMSSDASAIPALAGAQKPSEEDLRALDAGIPNQPLHVAGLLTGTFKEGGWDSTVHTIDWQDAMAATDRLAQRLHATLTRVALPQAAALPQGLFAESWHPGRTAVLQLENGTPVGIAGELHPHVTAKLGIPEHSAAFELDLTAIFASLASTPLQAHLISTFPPVKQDLAFTVDQDMTNADLTAAIRRGAGDYLESIDLFDVYQGDDLGEGKKSLAYAVVFRSSEKTLKAKDSAAIRANIVAEAEKLGAQLRS